MSLEEGEEGESMSRGVEESREGREEEERGSGYRKKLFLEERKNEKLLMDKLQRQKTKSAVQALIYIFSPHSSCVSVAHTTTIHCQPDGSSERHPIPGVDQNGVGGQKRTADLIRIRAYQ
jgi:hypothetical protein